MRVRLPLSLVALGIVWPLAGCELIDKIPPPTSANRPVYSNTDDGWKRSALWLYATEGVAGGKAGECQRMAELLAGEQGCKGALCKTGSELAGEWLGKCTEIAADAVDAVRTAEPSLRKRAAETPTPCAKEYDALLGSGCQPDTCQEKAQDWATRCGDTEAGALTGAVLQSRVARRVGAGVGLDLRGCATMAKDLLEGAKCADETACREALPHVEAYAARCQSDGRLPDVTTAVAQLAITAGANREPAPIAVSEDVQPLSPDQLPLVLADGSGAVLSLCHQRPVDLEGFLTLQERCVGTPLTIARLFYGKSGKPSVQVGELPAPDEFDPPSPYPWLEIAGERAHYAKIHAEALRAQLAEVAYAGGSAALGELVTVIDQYAPWLNVSPEVQKELREADAALIPVFTQAAAVKVKGSKRVFAASQLRGFYARAKSRPLADLSKTGSFSLGANTEAYWLEAATLLPQATAAYRKGLAPLDERVRYTPALLPMVITEARNAGIERAKACAAAQTEEVALESKLNGCVFTGCDEAEISRLTDQWREARRRAQQERIAADVALGPTGSGPERAALASKQGCDEPGW